MNWFRVYHDIIDDPKILALEPSARWFYVACMSVASRMQPRGSLPSREAMAIHLRLRNDYANRAIDLLIKAGLIEQDVQTKALTIHGWEKRQRISDDSYARVKRFRDPERNVSETAPRVRASELELERDKEKENPPFNPPKGKTKKPAKSDPFILDADVPADDWAAYEEMRLKIRKPMTDHCKRLAVAELRRLAAAGSPMSAVLQKSILRSDQGLWPVNGHGANGVAPKLGKVSRQVAEGKAALARGESLFANDTTEEELLAKEAERSQRAR